MRKVFTPFWALLFLLSGLSSVAAGPARIDIEETTLIYCVSTKAGNLGVYTIPISGSLNPVKISGTIQYAFTNSGGTFTDGETVYGTRDYYSYYAIKATAAGADGQAWAHSMYAYRDPDNVNFTNEIICTDMACNPANNKIYGWFRKGSGYALGEYTGEDAANVKVTTIGSETSTVINALAFDAEGTLWGIAGSESGAVYTIDTTTGELTKKGSLNLNFPGLNQSAAIDPATGKLYWGATNTMNTQMLYEVDLKDMSYTAVYSMGFNYGFNAFFIPAKTPAGAPAAAEDLKAEFAGTGTDVKVTCTAPSRTYGGAALSGELNWKVLIDGNAPGTDGSGTIEAGAAFSKTYTTTKGDHTVAISFTNTAGNGPAATTDVNAGFDSPKAVTGLSLSADGNKVTVSWNAPEGERGGILDSENISYTVTRNPGSVVVAERTKSLSVTDEIPEGRIKPFTYVVTVNEGEQAGPQAVSGSILVGEPYDIPYSLSFSDVENLDDACFKTTIDMGNDQLATSGWILGEIDGEKCVKVTNRQYFEHTYSLYTAPISFIGGVEYTLKFKIALTSADESNAKVGMDIMLVSNQSKIENDVVMDIRKGYTYFSTEDNVNKFVEQTVTFTPVNSGVYSVCFFDNNTNNYRNYNSFTFGISSIDITGKFRIPAPAEQLKAEAVTSGSRDIKLTFVLPSKDINGEDLTAISKVEIYRGSGELVATISDPSRLTPGDAVEEIIGNAPRGSQSYKVIVYNGDFASEPTSPVSVVAGYLVNLKIVNAEFPAHIAIDGRESVEIEVMNDGAEEIAGYTVELLENGRVVKNVEGVSLKSDETHVFTFDIEWSESSPESAAYSAAVVCEGEENTDDSVTDEFTVTFEQKNDGMAIVTGVTDVCVTAKNGVLTIVGNAPVSIYDMSGHIVAATYVNGLWSRRMVPGVYVVCAGGKACKVVL